MAIFFATNNAAGLLTAFNEAIANNQPAKGAQITTWDSTLYEKRYFYTHKSQNWGKKAWLRADIEPNRLAFYIQPYDKVPLTRDTYSYYAGHLIETFLRHFFTTFTMAQATPVAVALPSGAAGDATF
jgi:hypothetical protein